MRALTGLNEDRLLGKLEQQYVTLTEREIIPPPPNGVCLHHLYSERIICWLMVYQKHRKLCLSLFACAVIVAFLRFSLLNVSSVDVRFA
jgi:hypothetical protein